MRSLPLPRLARLLSGSFLLGLMACPAVGHYPHDALREVTFESLAPFESAEAFDAWAVRVRDIQRDYKGGWGFGSGCADSRSAPQADNETSDDVGESITNNQEAGVDEGGIVKAAGDYLVVLRRGRLFTLRVGPDPETLAPVHAIDAFPPGPPSGTWYDEMLLHDDRIIVVGFSYQHGATELGFFRLGEDGSLSHESTHYVRSNDYYSSRNYASRLVGNTLIFYMPYGLNLEARHLPAMRAAGTESTGWNDLVSTSRILRPIQPSVTPVLHTVVRCDLSEASPNCRADAFVGPWARSFYVSANAVYVWVGPEHETAADTARDDANDSVVYRIALTADPEDPAAGVSALRARGMPVDQFSFRERHDRLDVLVAGNGAGDAMFHPEIGTGEGQELALLRVPLSSFATNAPTAQAERYTGIPGKRSWALQNRFVGDFLLWGEGSGWYAEAASTDLFVTLVEVPEEALSFSLGHAVERIEALGSHGAVVVGGGGSDLHFTTIRLDNTPMLAGSHTEADANQGETRSHGFFFKPGGEGGIASLPLRKTGGSWQHLLYGSAAMLFLDVDGGLDLARLGTLDAQDERQEDDCVASCVDWYGNARPIFYRDRTFALLGYELVEGAVENGQVVELRRTNFLP